MKIGVFDSGLGGLLVLKHLREALPDYNYVFFGDQANVPYGNKTVEELTIFTKQALLHLYKEQNCKMVLLACNTTSSTIYDELCKWVESEFPGRLLFGIVIPTVLALEGEDNIAFFGTQRTIMSHAYRDALPGKNVSEVAMPELATMIEAGDNTLNYISTFKDLVPKDVATGALVCTHYGIAKDDFKKAFPKITKWFLQEEIVSGRFKIYFQEKPEIEKDLSKEGTIKVLISADSAVFRKFLKEWFGPVALKVKTF